MKCNMVDYVHLVPLEKADDNVRGVRKPKTKLKKIRRKMFDFVATMLTQKEEPSQKRIILSDSM